jgi:hypothetical protein
MSLPARIDLADVGPGVAWAFEFGDDGRGRLLSSDSPPPPTRSARPRKRPPANWIVSKTAFCPKP